MKKLFAIFANEGPELVTMINDLAIGDDGWAQIAPYGDYPGIAYIPDGNGGFKREKAVQRLDKTAVTQMANEYQQSSKGVSGFFRKRPLFEGHPDMPVGGEKYPNKYPVGLFTNIASRDDGLYGEPVLTEAGERMIANKAYRALSGHWSAELVGKEGDVNVYRPNKFLSAGLTNSPNLPVQLLNEAEPSTQPSTKNQNILMLKKLIPWLAKHGITVANEATEDQVDAALAQLDPKITSAATLANEKATLANEKATLDGKIITLNTEKTTLAAERDNHRTQFLNERKARIDSEVGRALKDGRITDADKPTWLQRLANEASFANEVAALEGLKPTVKTESVIELGKRKVDVSSPKARRVAIDECMAEIANEKHFDLDKPKDRDKAYNETAKRHPALFSQMQHPKVKAR